jgi:proteasome-associated ATPase
MQVKVPELLNKYVGETERNIRLVFQRAQALSRDGVPVVIFFDEMDVLFHAADTGATNPVGTFMAQLLSEIDELEALRNIVVIGASNRADTIDPALLRPGRFDTRIYVGRPDRAAATEILGRYLTADLPYPGVGEGSAATRYRDGIVRALVDLIFDGTAATTSLAEVTFESGHCERVSFSQFLSGAALRDVADHAKRRALKRAMYGGSLAIEGADLHDALRAVIDQARRLLSATRWDDWAQISGARGENITLIRALSADGQPERLVVPDMARRSRTIL